MAINVQITKNGTENAASVLRRFVKKVRTAGFLQTVRARRYYVRDASQLRRKNSKLVQLERTEKWQELEKSGKSLEQ